MTKEQLLRRQIRSMARSMEAEGANFQEMENHARPSARMPPPEEIPAWTLGVLSSAATF